ncbi:hypothetical protein ACMU_09985 [Actibacterium mucosum KCTC 23349]|uniref:ABC transporter substrate-binding protein n=1 Tax=Actibacterium mucosum KCTC 23349 TaxID=1454373 RepID=A0A037ZIZ1_9RHOB|nr:ABC transporter substrate-binding protein [Actibacterium mucosum]KAJ56078.1 hypothetical protein ACMU_09985 [Actibacterium mucosum KCTC 23349]
MKPLHVLAVAAAILGTSGTSAQSGDWTKVESAARGQTVYWHAWGGATTTNDFIRWVGDQVAASHGVTLEHVKLSDTADAVGRVVAEKAAGKDTGGAVDLIWINGANFAAMKEAGLLYPSWVETLPNWQYVDVAGKPAVTSDFTVPTDGQESPWAMAQVVFYYDSARLPEPPTSIAALGDWAAANPGRFTYPQPPDFLGTTFLKQALIELTADATLLQQPADAVDYDAVTAPLWNWLDRAHPHLWRAGRAFPQTGPRQLQMMADGEIDLAISFSPGEASAAIANGQLPDTVRTFVLEGGTIGNASFVAIPYNASAPEGAMVLANFLLSPEAQSRAQDPEILGYGTVLDMDALAPADRALFDALDLGIATLSPAELGAALPEPDPSWATALADSWTERYGVAR